MIGKSDQLKHAESHAGRWITNLSSIPQKDDKGPEPNKGISEQEEGLCNILNVKEGVSLDYETSEMKTWGSGYRK